MEELTAKQIAKIYREIAEVFEIKQDWFYVCLELKEKSGVDADAFEEFMLFKPTENEKEGVFAWWRNPHDENYNRTVRITTLLLCEQMALNP